MKFVQITDTHFVPPGAELHGLDPRQRLDACIADINANHGDAELCVITGDLAHKGQAEAYRHLRDCLSHLSIPYRLVIGNHDDRETFRDVFPEAACDENGFVQSVVETSAGRFIMLDSVEKGQHWGSFCAQRAAWLKAQLAAARDMAVYLFIHHHPFDIGIPSVDNIRLRDASLLRDTIAGYDNIRHLFLGHVHRPVAGNWGGLSYSIFRGTNHQVPFDLKTITPVPKSHEPPAYAVVFLTPDSVAVHIHDYLDRSALPLPPNPRRTA